MNVVTGHQGIILRFLSQLASCDLIGKNFNTSSNSGTGPLKGKTFAELISTIKNGDTRVNIHTPTQLNGEIRDQIESGGRKIQMQIQIKLLLLI
jgi:hypothetical protein